MYILKLTALNTVPPAVVWNVTSCDGRAVMVSLITVVPSQVRSRAWIGFDVAFQTVNRIVLGPGTFQQYPPASSRATTHNPLSGRTPDMFVVDAATGLAIKSVAAKPATSPRIFDLGCIRTPSTAIDGQRSTIALHLEVST
jgi:hypothetical protein